MVRVLLGQGADLNAGGIDVEMASVYRDGMRLLELGGTRKKIGVNYAFEIADK